MASENLGLVKAVHEGTTPPVNTVMLWFDTNPAQNVMKYYDIPTSTWKKLNTAINGSEYFGVTTGTNAYESTINIPITSYTTGVGYKIKFNSSNSTNTCTLNINGIGPKALVKQGGQAIQPGDIVSTEMLLVVDDGSVFYVVGIPMTINPSLAANVSFDTTTSEALNGNNNVQLALEELYAGGGLVTVPLDASVTAVNGLGKLMMMKQNGEAKQYAYESITVPAKSEATTDIELDFWDAAFAGVKSLTNVFSTNLVSTNGTYAGVMFILRWINPRTGTRRVLFVRDVVYNSNTESIVYNGVIADALANLIALFNGSDPNGVNSDHFFYDAFNLLSGSTFANGIENLQLETKTLLADYEGSYLEWCAVPDAFSTTASITRSETFTLDGTQTFTTGNQIDFYICYRKPNGTEGLLHLSRLSAVPALWTLSQIMDYFAGDINGRADFQATNTGLDFELKYSVCRADMETTRILITGFDSGDYDNSSVSTPYEFVGLEDVFVNQQEIDFKGIETEAVDPQVKNPIIGVFEGYLPSYVASRIEIVDNTEAGSMIITAGIDVPANVDVNAAASDIVDFINANSTFFQAELNVPVSNFFKVSRVTGGYFTSAGSNIVRWVATTESVTGVCNGSCSDTWGNDAIYGSLSALKDSILQYYNDLGYFPCGATFQDVCDALNLHFGGTSFTPENYGGSCFERLTSCPVVGANPFIAAFQFLMLPNSGDTGSRCLRSWLFTMVWRNDPITLVDRMYSSITAYTHLGVRGPFVFPDYDSGTNEYIPAFGYGSTDAITLPDSTIKGESGDPFYLSGGINAITFNGPKNHYVGVLVAIDEINNVGKVKLPHLYKYKNVNPENIPTPDFEIIELHNTTFPSDGGEGVVNYANLNAMCLDTDMQPALPKVYANYGLSNEMWRNLHNSCVGNATYPFNRNAQGFVTRAYTPSMFLQPNDLH